MLRTAIYATPEGRGNVLVLRTNIYATPEGRGNVLMLRTAIYATPEGRGNVLLLRTDIYATAEGRGYVFRHYRQLLRTFEIFRQNFQAVGKSAGSHGRTSGRIFKLPDCTSGSWKILKFHNVIALEKFKIRVCQGVSGGTKTPFRAIFAYFLRFLSFSSVFYIGITLYLVYNCLLYTSPSPRD